MRVVRSLTVTELEEARTGLISQGYSIQGEHAVRDDMTFWAGYWFGDWQQRFLETV